MRHLLDESRGRWTHCRFITFTELVDNPARPDTRTVIVQIRGEEVAERPDLPIGRRIRAWSGLFDIKPEQVPECGWKVVGINLR